MAARLRPQRSSPAPSRTTSVQPSSAPAPSARDRCRRSFRSAKVMTPDIEVLQEVPDEVKQRTETKGESSLRNHLKSEGEEQGGSQSYVPTDNKDDKALHAALDLLRGVQANSAFPPNAKAAVPN